MRSVLLLGIALASLASSASSQVLASDDFTYSGALTSNGWTAHSGAGNKVIMANGSHATIEQSSGSGEDVNLPYTQRGATDTTYAKFSFRVPSGNPVNPDAQGLYFAHFKTSGNFFQARTGVLSPAGGGDFVLAMNAQSSDLGAGASWSGDLSFDTWYTVVTSFNAMTAEARLWLDPTDSGSTSISHTGGFTGDLLEQYALRQSSDYTGFIDVDDIVVGETFNDVFPVVAGVPTVSGWSIGTMILGVLGACALIVRQRRLALA